MAKKIDELLLTPWFSSSEKPARPGVYQVEWALNRPVYAKFREGVWHYGSHLGVDFAAQIKQSNLDNPPLRWRGLAQDPAVSA